MHEDFPGAKLDPTASNLWKKIHGHPLLGPKNSVQFSALLRYKNIAYLVASMMYTLEFVTLTPKRDDGGDKLSAYTSRIWLITKI